MGCTETYRDGSCRDSKPFQSSPDLERLYGRSALSRRELEDDAHQQQVVHNRNAPQVDPVTGERIIGNGCAHIERKTYEKGIGVVKIRSNPVNASTSWFSAFNKFAKHSSG